MHSEVRPIGDDECFTEVRQGGLAGVFKVVESDGLALTHARWTLSATAPDGQPLELQGRGTIVSRRQGDGTWRIAIDDPLTPP